MAKSTRVFYLVGQFPAINHGYLLAEITHLRQFGIEVLVASVSPPDRLPEQLTPAEREEAARTYYIKSVPAARTVLIHFVELLRHPLRYLRGLILVVRLARGHPSRVLFHMAYFAEAVLVGRRMRESGVSHVLANFSATVALITSRIFPVTMSFTVHGFGELYDPVGTSLAERVAGSLFVRSVSRYGRGQLMLSCERKEWSKLLYFPLGIDAPDFAPEPLRAISSPPRLLCVGRLAPEKGQALLLQAIADLHRDGSPVHLRLAGDGPDRQWLEQRAAELGISSSIDFLGWVDPLRLRDLYSQTDLFVLPSLAEGIPIVLMEAMAMQLPCVAPRIAGIPELIEDGVDGMLFAVADVNELSEKIRTLLSSPELCRTIGMNARARVVRDYDIALNTQRFAAALAERIGARNPPE
ncbi:MAG: glycosyltransferase [Candidatus Sulfotelmatobacter sp.]